MAIYDISGDAIAQPFNVVGDGLSEAYDVEGNTVFSLSPKPEYGIENVKSYFRSDTQRVANEINLLSDDWQSFIFVTDTHQSNMWNSAPIIMYLLSNTDIDMMFHGGDCIAGAWSTAEYMKFFDPIIENGFGSFVYPVIGNHELYLYNGATYSDLKVIYDTFLDGKAKIKGYPEAFYYYFDVAGKKTRYLFINTSDTAGNRVTQTQLDWLGSAITLPSNEWSIVVIGHIDIDASNITGQWKSTQAAQVTTILSSCNGRVVGYFCGHEHIDQLRLVSNKFYQLISLCDVFENDNYFNVDNYPTRTRGTNTEQAVTVVSFNTKTGDVVTRRIGAGDSYSWNYITRTAGG